MPDPMAFMKRWRDFDPLFHNNPIYLRAFADGQEPPTRPASRPATPARRVTPTPPRTVKISPNSPGYRVRRVNYRPRGGPWVVGTGEPAYGFPSQAAAQKDADRRREKKERELSAMAASEQARERGEVGRWGLALPKHAAKRDKKRLQELLPSRLEKVPGGQYTRVEILRILDRTDHAGLSAVVRMTDRMLERQTPDERRVRDARYLNELGFNKPDSFKAEKLRAELNSAPPAGKALIHYKLSELLAKYAGRQLLDIMNKGAARHGFAMRGNPRSW